MPHSLKNCCLKAPEVHAAGTRPKVELMAGSASLMRIMMAELAEFISADSIFANTHLYPGE